MKHLRMNTTYDFDIRLLVDIAHKGIVHVTMDNVRAKIGIDMKVITKNDKKYIYISKMNTILTLTEFTYKFDESEKEMIQLHEIINNVIQNDKKNIVSKVKPALEETVTKRIISILNDAFYTRYEEIFPERT
ncbi:uncharacterized protein LOC105423223 [Pogonomyrmex barbatus]|uniref:Uncharacterized protein LOC105423223 n=1 Tax=Pogonomyrmex barbatus TaxID=144034 RepID=A0A6I9VYU7_9HYME|nr:uncharacterized protein LOC105423223 [Pogonomyrmex barbatus]